MNTLEKEYRNLLEYQPFDKSSIDTEILQRDIDQLSTSPFLQSCALSIFDVYSRQQVYNGPDYDTIYLCNMLIIVVMFSKQ